MTENQYDQQLDVLQIAFLAIGTGLFINGILATSQIPVPISRLTSLALGLTLLVFAWYRNFLVVRFKRDSQDPRFPAMVMDGGDRVVVWMTWFVALGSVLGACGCREPCHRP
jgi:hypothetical protein